MAHEHPQLSPLGGPRSGPVPHQPFAREQPLLLPTRTLRRCRSLGLCGLPPHAVSRAALLPPMMPVQAVRLAQSQSPPSLGCNTCGPDGLLRHTCGTCPCGGISFLWVLWSQRPLQGPPPSFLGPTVCACLDSSTDPPPHKSGG